MFDKQTQQILENTFAAASFVFSQNAVLQTLKDSLKKLHNNIKFKV